MTHLSLKRIGDFEKFWVKLWRGESPLGSILRTDKEMDVTVQMLNDEELGLGSGRWSGEKGMVSRIF